MSPLQKTAHSQRGMGIDYMIELKKYIRGKLVFLGIGNPMRGDDGIGVEFIEELKNHLYIKSFPVYLFNGNQLPENYLEPIVKIKPATVFLVDAVDFGASPGTFKLFKKAEPEMHFSTHTLSLNFILGYLKEKTEANIFILGIQPGQIHWGSGLSPEVQKGIKKLVDQLIQMLLHVAV